ncbi:SMI1/KNR4 family protein [Verrucomicrobiaceae bacterium 5K15]|uniref:SMI1/KNR4 family protein n=1 Tax=Oceaniferula flava TaxID=2800421 RepID=A0AAE2SGS4_9BACT|nr:SMI1/KNR4 family protein [Oceaniferula flavus]MBK1856607.1 SMI1/KNR4 family protein [Oceaniferula flavus]MBM1137915.1 SMI1/KNR4 family protein [Oceaniferula flavus]
MDGKLAEPASLETVNELERSLGVTFPDSYRGFLGQHDGSETETDDAIWRFWPCSEIKSYTEYREKGFFIPDHNDIRNILPSVKNLTFLGHRMIVFADALIDAPSYGMYLDEGHVCHNWIFDISYGYVSAISFDEWSKIFVEQAEYGLIFRGQQ